MQILQEGETRKWLVDAHADDSASDQGIRTNGVHSSRVRLSRDWLQLLPGWDVWSLPRNGCCQIIK